MLQVNGLTGFEGEVSVSEVEILVVSSFRSAVAISYSDFSISDSDYSISAEKYDVRD